jgi:hypothetical protein
MDTCDRGRLASTNLNYGINPPAGRDPDRRPSRIQAGPLQNGTYALVVLAVAIAGSVRRDPSGRLSLCAGIAGARRRGARPLRTPHSVAPSLSPNIRYTVHYRLGHRDVRRN